MSCTEVGKAHPERGQHHPMAWSCVLDKKGTRENSLSTSIHLACFLMQLDVRTRAHASAGVTSPPRLFVSGIWSQQQEKHLIQLFSDRKKLSSWYPATHAPTRHTAVALGSVSMTFYKRRGYRVRAGQCWPGIER